ncbi:hypothetical protein GYMLUDRAFT_252266 [Collybiopsis luxurians FD-317 M1]|uniref:Uncharacterized protein n=1 Tax=Collybiopsis luxurians FD-317 M1 TaxID=944289 RepID=A0A0D0BNV1_9AGAR|nr:hypothetical protein GYMLUDRAFT_252266 [Collybiopsis luxurians FD-317 M1]
MNYGEGFANVQTNVDTGLGLINGPATPVEPTATVTVQTGFRTTAGAPPGGSPSGPVPPRTWISPTHSQKGGYVPLVAPPIGGGGPPYYLSGPGGPRGPRGLGGPRGSNPPSDRGGDRGPPYWGRPLYRGGPPGGPPGGGGRGGGPPSDPSDWGTMDDAYYHGGRGWLAVRGPRGE